MRTFGILLIILGLALLVYAGLNILKERGRIISPIPEDRGVKVIFITPTK